MSISKQRTALFFRLSISLTVFSALFKFMPSFLIVLGALGMIISLSLQLVQKEQRTLLDYARLFLILSFSGNYLGSLLEVSYAPLLMLMTKLALIIFLLLYIRKILMSFQDITQNNGLWLSGLGRDNLSYILADLATVYIVVASMFKILHWEIGVLNGNVLLSIGLFTALISLLATSRELGKQ